MRAPDHEVLPVVVDLTAPEAQQGEVGLKAESGHVHVTRVSGSPQMTPQLFRV